MPKKRFIALEGKVYKLDLSELTKIDTFLGVQYRCIVRPSGKFVHFPLTTKFLSKKDAKILAMDQIFEEISRRKCRVEENLREIDRKMKQFRELK